MKKLDKLQESFLAQLLDLGVSEPKAKHLTYSMMVKVRRELSIKPLTKPSVLIEDRINEGKGIVIVIRKEKAPEYNAAIILDEYLEKHEIKGDWIIKEAFHPNPNVVAWKATRQSPTKVSETKKATKTITETYKNLPQEKKDEILKQLRATL